MPRLPIQPRNFLTGADDPTLGDVTFLSRPAEWHAVAIGALVALDGSGTLAAALVALLLGRSWGKAALENRIPDSLHLRDVIREPAYAFGAWLAFRVVLVVLYGRELVPPGFREAIPV